MSGKTNGIDHAAAAKSLNDQWANDARWKGITRNYSAEDVLKLRGSIKIEYSLAKLGAERLWHLLNTEPYVPTFGALTGTQAVQMVRGGLKAIYMSGWQIAGDMNLAAQTYPDQSLYPANSVPAVVKRLNNAMLRADQIQTQEGVGDTYWIEYVSPTPSCV